MKKTLIVPLACAFALSIATNVVCAEPTAIKNVPQAQTTGCKIKDFHKVNAKQCETITQKYDEWDALTPEQKEQKIKEHKEKRMAELDKRLGLTEAQKTKAQELRLKGHEEMKQLMQEINLKKAEMEAVKKSRIAIKAQEEKLCALKEEVKAIKVKMGEMRAKNMQEFEGLLDAKQKIELDEIKTEQRIQHEIKREECGCECECHNKAKEAVTPTAALTPISVKVTAPTSVEAPALTPAKVVVPAPVVAPAPTTVTVPTSAVTPTSVKTPAPAKNPASVLAPAPTTKK